MTQETDNGRVRAAVRKLVAERVGRHWCLFLDRDGVINQRVVGDYVRSWEQFVWMPGARDAMWILRQWAPHLVVVTNQQGVGKGLMSLNDVTAIHDRIQDDLSVNDSVVEEFLICPHLESEECGCRKPRPGLVADWLRGHADSEPSLSIIVGDRTSDLELARNVAAATGGCTTVHITGGGPAEAADVCVSSLMEFAVEVTQARKDVLG